MEISRTRSARALTIGPVAAFFGSAALFATGFAVLTWNYIPYERLERFSPADRFQLWEGVVWLLALLLTFVGIACIVEVMGWRVREAVGELARRLSASETRTPLIASGTVPWWMVTAGILSMLIGTLGRYLLLS